MPVLANPDVLVGYATSDDAGVFRIDVGRALVQTVDFFTPVVDDPYTYGAIAAANSLSDVYAMGGKPLTALAIACFPDKVADLEMLCQIMRGGLDKLNEADVVLLGGHTVSDNEIKFGYSITGIVHPEQVAKNSGARPGDVLILSKPLGIGLLTTGIKYGKTSPAAEDEVIRVMCTLNRAPSEVMLRHGCHAATDITGNGLLGHAFEMAEASGVTLRFQSDSIPFIPEAYALSEARLLPRTIASTWKMIQDKTLVSPRVAEPLKNILLDPQTSGGLLLSIPPAELNATLSDMAKSQVQAKQIGTVEKSRGYSIVVD